MSWVASWTLRPFKSSAGEARAQVIGGARLQRTPNRQTKRWEDNIGEWAGLAFAKSQRAVENWEKWRKLVVKLYVVPQRPSRLRDR